MDIIELNILNFFIIIYNVFEYIKKNNKSDKNEITEKKDENNINSLIEKLKILIENIKEAIYNISKEKEIKGDIIYYELISNLLLDELLKEKNLEYKIYILKEFF